MVYYRSARRDKLIPSWKRRRAVLKKEIAALVLFALVFIKSLNALNWLYNAFITNSGIRFPLRSIRSERVR